VYPAGKPGKKRTQRNFTTCCSRPTEPYSTGELGKKRAQRNFTTCHSRPTEPYFTGKLGKKRAQQIFKTCRSRPTESYSTGKLGKKRAQRNFTTCRSRPTEPYFTGELGKKRAQQNFTTCRSRPTEPYFTGELGKKRTQQIFKTRRSRHTDVYSAGELGWKRTQQISQSINPSEHKTQECVLQANWGKCARHSEISLVMILSVCHTLIQSATHRVLVNVRMCTAFPVLSINNTAYRYVGTTCQNDVYVKGPLVLSGFLSSCGKCLFHPKACVALLPSYIYRVGQNHIHIRFIHGIFGREITKYTVICSVYTRFWPTLYINTLAPTVMMHNHKIGQNHVIDYYRVYTLLVSFPGFSSNIQLYMAYLHNYV